MTGTKFGIKLKIPLVYTYHTRVERYAQYYLHLPAWLEKGTLGDRNFIRFLTKSQPLIKDLDTTSDVISISGKENIYEASSSWFFWSRNISTCIGCDYCVIFGIEHLKNPTTIGCNPVNLGNLQKS